MKGLLVLTEEFDLVLKASLDGQSLQDAAQQSRWFLFAVLTARMAQVQLHLQEGLQTCRLWWYKSNITANATRSGRFAVIFLKYTTQEILPSKNTILKNASILYKLVGSDL